MPLVQRKPHRPWLPAGLPPWAGSLRVRLTLWQSLGLLLVTAFFAAYFAPAELARVQQARAHRLQALAHALAGPASAGRWLAADDGGIDRALADDVELRSIALLTADGRVRASRSRAIGGPLTPPAGPPAPAQAVPRPDADPADGPTDSGHGTLVAWHPVSLPGLNGWLRLECATDALQAIRRGLLVRIALIGLLATLLAGLLQWRLLRGPMQRLEAARRFAEGLVLNTAPRLSVGDGADEIVALGIALNTASLRLAQHQEAIATAIDALTRNETALSESNDQLGAIFSLSPDGLLSFDAAGRVHYANHAFARLCGQPQERLLGADQQTLSSLLAEQLEAPEAWVGLAACFEPAAEAPAAGDAGLATAPPARRVSAPRTLAFRGPPARTVELVGVLDPSASVQRLLYLRDISEQAALDRLKSEFLSTAAHELRTPMASMYAFIELLMTRDFPPERQKLYLGKVYRQIHAVIAILNELLDLSRIEARGGQDFRLETVSLVEVIDAAIADFPVPEGREAPRWQPPARGAFEVRADRAKLAQVLVNLLSNAYKYSPAGGPVALHLAADGPATAPQHLIEVRDQGIGMTPAQLGRVCERFYRADSSGKIPGTGLGMSIVKEILELHGGRLEIESRPGEGTLVRCRLRAEAGARADAAMPPPAVAPTAAAPAPGFVVAAPRPLPASALP